MLVIFVPGFFFDWLEIRLIIVPVFAPVIAGMAAAFAPALGLEGLPLAELRSLVRLWFAILVAVNLQTSFLTPPFGFALFVLKGSAPPELRLAELHRGVLPFVAIQLAGLSCVAPFPWLALAFLR